MASLGDLKRRIASVKSTRKITKAMKMIAAVRLRRAAETISAARPYALKLHEALSHLSQRLSGKRHPLLQRPGEKSDIKKVELLVITSDRGLCGGFNTNILRYAEAYRRRQGDKFEISISVIGRKGAEFYAARRIPVRKRFTGVYENLNFETASRIADELVKEYEAGTFDSLRIIYNEFKSAITQKVTDELLLPIAPLDLTALETEETASDAMLKLPHDAAQASGQTGYDYEPSKDKLLDVLLPRYFRTQVYRALLESVASEYGSRMTAMDSATNNASDMIKNLSLVYNRARQAAITKELMEIIGGKEALEG